MEFAWVLAAAVTGLGIQWMWITGAALRSARGRTARAFSRLEREIAQLAQETDVEPETRALIGALEQSSGELATSLRKGARGGNPAARFAELVQALELARGFLEGSDGEKRRMEPLVLRLDWVELAVWDCSERLEEERRCWAGPGAFWVGRRLGLSPIATPPNIPPNRVPMAASGAVSAESPGGVPRSP